MAWLLWLLAALVLGVIEMLVVDLTFLMFAGGALAAMGAALLVDSLTIQVVVFAVVSVLLLLAVRPFLRRSLARSGPNITTNAQALVGRDAIAIAAVDRTDGRVRLGSEVWSARLAESETSPVVAGTKLRVLRIDGAYAIVAPATERK